MPFGEVERERSETPDAEAPPPLLDVLEHKAKALGVIDEANRVLAINYHSQMVTKAVWTRWSRQARGTVVHLLPSGRFTLLKRLLDRGVEMLLNVHLETEIAATQGRPRRQVPRHHVRDAVRATQRARRCVRRQRARSILLLRRGARLPPSTSRRPADVHMPEHDGGRRLTAPT